VGIGTGAPLSLLHVAHAGHLNAVFERNDNSKEHLTLVVGSEGSGLRFSDSNVFFVASQPFADRADNTFGTEHLRITAAGNVGLGTTAPGQLLTLGAPEGTRLEIARVAASLPWTSGGVLNPGAFAINQQSAGTAAPGADFALMRDGKKRLSLGDVNTYVSSQDNGEILFLINHEEAGALEVMRMTAGGRVGVGTALPAERLDVRGEIRLGANGDFFALGGLQPLRLVAGHVTAAGNLLRGQGFGPIRTNQGQYHVSFSVPFTTPPIVVVAPVDADGEDNLLTVRNLVAGGFDVTARDTTPPNEGDLLDTAFTFVAFGPRA
jgi:hypothetical protein